MCPSCSLMVRFRKGGKRPCSAALFTWAADHCSPLFILLSLQHKFLAPQEIYTSINQDPYEARNTLHSFSIATCHALDPIPNPLHDAVIAPSLQDHTFPISLYSTLICHHTPFKRSCASIRTRPYSYVTPILYTSSIPRTCVFNPPT